IYVHNAAPPGALTPQGSLEVGQRACTQGAEIDPKTLDPLAPSGSKVIKLTSPPNAYVYTSRGGTEVAKARAADASLASAITNHTVIGLENTIRIFGGDVLGKVAKAPTDATLRDLGTFVHVETFSEENLLTTAGFLLIDASDAAKVADRKELTSKL